jgi:predicted metalloprotease with PDZ domain
VLEGSPAMAAGLYADDEILALDGTRCDATSLLSRCEDRRPGETVEVTVFRRDRLVAVPVTLGFKPVDAAYLVRVERPTDEQKAAYRAWLSTPWDESPLVG